MKERLKNIKEMKTGVWLTGSVLAILTLTTMRTHKHTLVGTRFSLICEKMERIWTQFL